MRFLIIFTVKSATWAPYKLAKTFLGLKNKIKDLIKVTKNFTLSGCQRSFEYLDTLPNIGVCCQFFFFKLGN